MLKPTYMLVDARRVGDLLRVGGVALAAARRRRSACSPSSTCRSSSTRARVGWFDGARRQRRRLLCYDASPYGLDRLSAGMEGALRRRPTTQTSRALVTLVSWALVEGQRQTQPRSSHRPACGDDGEAKRAGWDFVVTRSKAVQGEPHRARRRMRLAGDGLEHALGDVEVRVDVLHVVVVLELVDQAQDLLRRRPRRRPRRSSSGASSARRTRP